MKRAALALLFLLLLPVAALAQAARVVSVCGATAPFGPLTAGSQVVLSVDTNGTLCSAGGGGGGTFTWPGTAPLTAFGTAPSGTVPAVNASSFQGGTWTVQPGNTANTTPWLINEQQIAGVTVATGLGASNTGTQRVALSSDSPGGAAANPSFAIAPAATTGGATPKIFSGLTTTVLVQAGVHQVYKVQCDNLAGSANAWVQLIDTASAGSLGTGVVDQVALPVGGTGGFALATGEAFANGIVIGAATASNGATAVSTAVNCAVAYK